MDARQTRSERRRRRGSPPWRRRFGFGRVPAIAVAALTTLVAQLPCRAADTPGIFYTGGDISLATFMQQQNVVFRDAGVAKPPETILYDHGANLFRLRLFVNPQTTYTNQNFGAIQSLDYTIALAQRLKANAPRAKLLLDFHYSDTWADPGHQSTPAAWSNQTLAQLETTIRSYTSTSLTAFKNAGVMPDMVQVGNEIQSGMLWEAGRINFSGTTTQQRASWQNFGRLVKSAIAGVRDAQGAGPKIDVAVHPGQSDVGPFFFGRLTDPNYGNVPTAGYDVMGVSYYPTTAQLGVIQSHLTTLVNTYNKKVMVLETNAPWTSQFAPASDPSYPDTPQGQADFLADLRDMVLTLPGGNGMGVLWWYPESVQVPGYNIYNGGSTAMFNASRNALPVVDALQPALAWVGGGGSGGAGNWSEAAKWDLNRVPNTPSLHVRIDTTANSAVMLDRDATIGRLTVGAGDSLSIPAGRSLALAGPGETIINGIVHSAGNVAAASAAVTVSGPTAEFHFDDGQLDAGRLDVRAGATVLMSAGGGGDKTLKVAGLSFDLASGATIDVADNKLVIAGGDVGAFDGMRYSGVTGMIASAYNFGTWDSPWILTSMPAAGPTAGVTTLAVATADETFYAGGAFGGVSVASGDLLVMYTYAGDLNLDGLVDGADCGIIDNSVQFPGTSGYANGDINYDGVIDGADYGIIDNSIQLQGPPISAGAAPWNSIRAVPEPHCVVIGLVALVITSARRQRR